MNKVIHVAGGCFWGIEKYYQMVEGIIDTDCGYANGNIENPKYEQLKQGVATHAETVKITYDSGKISLREILEHFFELVNPFSLNHQGVDYGLQYRTGIYYENEEDKEVTLDFLNDMQKNFDDKIVIAVEPLENYYSAEEYHQDYYTKNPEELALCPLFKN